MPMSVMSLGGSGGAGGQPGELDPEMQAARKRMEQATYGRAQTLQNDPYNKAALDYMKGTVSGQNVPFSNTVKNSMMAQHGAGSAAAEAAQMETLRQSLGASGGSIYDPGYQAAQRQAMSQRQGSNLDAAGQLEAKAGIANQQASAQAANSMAAARNAQNAQVNQMGMAGANLDAQRTAAVPQGGVPGMPGAPNPLKRNLGSIASGMNGGISEQNQRVFRI
jgi:hypothetical protein